MNDRFAYGDADSMLRVYMTQFEQQLNSSRGTRLPPSQLESDSRDIEIATSQLIIDGA